MLNNNVTVAIANLNKNEFSIEDLKIVAFDNYENATTSEWELCKFTLISVLEWMVCEGRAIHWYEDDRGFQDTLLHSGYLIVDTDDVFITDYSGIAGCYWQGNMGCYPICKQ